MSIQPVRFHERGREKKNQTVLLSTNDYLLQKKQNFFKLVKKLEVEEHPFKLVPTTYSIYELLHALMF